MKIVLSGTYYPLTMLSYFRNALERRDDVELFTTGPFTENWIPWQGGMYLPHKYVKPVDLPLDKSIISRMNFPIQLVQSHVPFKPDLWLQIDAAFHFTGKPISGKNFIVGTDPHCLNYDEQRGLADKFFCMQTPYMKSGDIYLPYAYDPQYCYPDPSVEKTMDVAMLGVQYDERLRAASAFRSLGYKVCNDTGDIFDEYREKNLQCKIGFNWSSLKDLTARVWEFAGMALPMVVNRVPDLDLFFVEGEDYLGFDTLDEAVAQVQRLLSDEELQKKLGTNAHQKVASNHTWDKRIEFILGQV